MTPIDAHCRSYRHGGTFDWSLYVSDDIYQVGRDQLLPVWQRKSDLDRQFCEINQSGVNSPLYQPGPYSLTRETNVQHFVNWYIGALSSDPTVSAQLKSTDNENLGSAHV